MILRQKIVELFPTENLAVYYTPYIKKKDSDTGKSIKSSGKLLHKYQSLKKIQEDLLQNRRLVNDQDLKEVNDEPPDDIEESINWLQNNEQPWETTELHWKKSFAFRRSKIIKTADKKISGAFNEWPILKVPNGYKLIVIDFQLDFKVFAQVALLCHMVPSTARIRQSNKKFWKPSCAESLDEIIAEAKIYGDIDKIKADRHAFAISKKITVQPYIIIVGETDFSIESIYICIDEILYEIPTLLQAIDICFKSLHVFDARFPVQSEQFWLLLQVGLYKFKTKWDSSITVVNDILGDMGCNIRT